MREAAADLDFEEAARLRDEIKRLRATELAVVDDPTAKRPASAGARARARASRTSRESPSRRTRSCAARWQKGEARLHWKGRTNPTSTKWASRTWHEVKPARSSSTSPLAGEVGAKRREGGARKPTLDEMGPGVESVPSRADSPRSKLGRPAGDAGRV